MTTMEFYPYKVYPPKLPMLVTPSVELPVSSDGALLAYRTDFEEVTLEIQVDIPPDLPERVVSLSERRRPPLATYVVLESIESRVRRAQKLDGLATSKVQIVMNRREFRGETAIRAVVVRTSDGRPSDPYAKHPGSVVAASEIQRVLFDEPPFPPGAYLEIKWVDFGGLDAPRWLQERANDLLALDLDQALPVLFLNSGVQHAPAILNSRGTRGLIAAARDSLYAGIYQYTMYALIDSAMHELASRQEEEDYDASELGDLLPGWRGQLLDRWVGQLFPDASDPVQALKRAVVTTPGVSELLGKRLSRALQKRPSTIGKAFTSLVRELQAEGRLQS